MRFLAILLLSLASVWAQTAPRAAKQTQSGPSAVPRSQTEQAKIAAVLKQMESDEQTGDFDAWLHLWAREKSAEMEKMRPYVKARPEVRYRPVRIFIQGDQAVAITQASARSFVTITFRQEDGQWRIQDEFWRETAPDPNSVYAFVPPAPGAFARAGSHWEQIPPAMDAASATRRGWQMKTVFDESFLYIRIESSDELPAPGSTVENPPGGWPVFKIVTSNNGSTRAGDFVLNVTVSVGDQATFDQQGKANSHRAFAAYAIRLELNDHEIFSTSADLKTSPLLTVAGRDYDIRIPLAALGISDSRAAKITVGDAQWPKAAILNVEARRFTP